MFCTQCGKRVLETMLFCPFCGAAIVVPEQDMPDAEAGGVLGAASSDSPVPQEASAATAVSPFGAESVTEASAADGPASDAEPGGEAVRRSSASSRPAQTGQGGGEAPAFSRLAGAGTVRENPAKHAAFDYAAPAALGSGHDEAGSQSSERGSSGWAASGRAHPASLFDDSRPDVDDVPQTIRYTRMSDASAAGDAHRRDDRRRPAIPLSPAGRAHTDGQAVSPSGERPDAGKSRARSAASQQRAQVGRQDEPQHRRSYIPVRDVDVNDMFMDDARPGSGASLENAFDDKAERFDYEEPERGSFFQRHIRGMVGLMLTLLLLVIFLIWACLPAGQRTLAVLNLAWSAGTYDELGHEAYDAGQPAQAATYFDRACSLDEENYDYAQSAMVAHYEAGDLEGAFELLKRCISLRPDDAAVYAQLLILFPDPDTRPWEASELLRQGYERTGDEALNVSSE